MDIVVVLDPLVDVNQELHYLLPHALVLTVELKENRREELRNSFLVSNKPFQYNSSIYTTLLVCLFVTDKCQNG